MKKDGGAYVTVSGHIKRVDEAEHLLILEEETRSRWKIFMRSRECKRGFADLYHRNTEKEKMPVSPESEQRIGLLSYARHMREYS